MDGAYLALKGYKYQFDKTITEILNNPTKDVQIEQIQDLGYDGYIIQVKFHDTDYNPSQKRQLIKKPLLQLIDEYIKTPNKKYILYIYLRDEQPRTVLYQPEDLITALGNKNTYYDNETLINFSKIFTLIYADNFHNSNNSLISKIHHLYCKSREEAELYYSIISSYLLDIIIHNPPTNYTLRKASKADIDTLINSNKQLIFHSSYIDFNNKQKYHKLLKRLYFNTTLNTSPFDRFFIIEELNPHPNLPSIKELILIISNKWGKTSIRTTQPFVPYIFFRGLDEYFITNLKKSLYSEGYKIKDGYEFKGSDFCLKSIKEPPSATNRIKFKIIDSESDLNSILNSVSSTQEIYQFFRTEPLIISTSVKHIKISISELNDVKTII